MHQRSSNALDLLRDTALDSKGKDDNVEVMSLKDGSERSSSCREQLPSIDALINHAQPSDADSVLSKQLSCEVITLPSIKDCLLTIAPAPITSDDKQQMHKRHRRKYDEIDNYYRRNNVHLYDGIQGGKYGQWNTITPASSAYRQSQVLNIMSSMNTDKGNHDQQQQEHSAHKRNKLYMVQPLYGTGNHDWSVLKPLQLVQANPPARPNFPPLHSLPYESYNSPLPSIRHQLGLYATSARFRQNGASHPRLKWLQQQEIGAKASTGSKKIRNPILLPYPNTSPSSTA